MTDSRIREFVSEQRELLDLELQAETDEDILATTAATETADEVEVVISGNAGAGGELSLKFFGISSDSPTA